MTPEEILDEAALKLGEHFDNVQIMVSWMDQGATLSCCRGCGNWHARHGLARDFITSDIAHENARQIAAKLNEDNGE